MKDLIHIYGQECWHDEAHILGDVAGLEGLRLAVDKAIRDGSGVAEVQTSDGEGYTIFVGRVSSHEMDRFRKPYTDEIAADARADALDPSTQFA